MFQNFRRRVKAVTFGSLEQFAPDLSVETCDQSKKKLIGSFSERCSEMTSSSKSWMRDITCSLKDDVKEHIRASHMDPGEQGKSGFYAAGETVVWKMIEETLHNQDVKTPHRSYKNRIIFQKKFSSPVGKHGRNGAPCSSVTVIYDTLDQSIVTAFPTT